MGMCLSGNVPKWECVRGQGRWTKDVLQVFDERMLIQRADGYNQKASDGPTLGQLIQSGRSRRRCGSSPGTDTARVGGAVRRRIVSVSQLHAGGCAPRRSHFRVFFHGTVPPGCLTLLYRAGGCWCSRGHRSSNTAWNTPGRITTARRPWKRRSAHRSRRLGGFAHSILRLWRSDPGADVAGASPVPAQIVRRGLVMQGALAQFRV